MDINVSNLPIIDREQGRQLAGGREELANEILAMLIKRLDKDLSLIKRLSENANYSTLKDEVHRLHGAVCYCGTPRLKAVLATLETTLKNNIMTDLPFLLDQLNHEISLVLEHYSSQQKTTLA